MSLQAWLVGRYCRGRHYRGKIHVARALGHALLPIEGGTYTLADGTRMKLHPRDWIEYRLLQRGDYEPLTLAFLRLNVLEGSTALLAGVNNGLHTITASRAAGGRGKVIGIEPQPASLLRARSNLLLNEGTDNVTLVASGLGARDAMVPMGIAPSHNSGMASLTEPTGSCPFHIPVRRLDGVLDDLHVTSIDLMLLDVEGYECEVLKGIGQVKPRVMVVESKEEHLRRGGSSCEEMFGVLEGHGYTMTDLHGKRVGPLDVLVESNLVARLVGVDCVWV